MTLDLDLVHVYVHDLNSPGLKVEVTGRAQCRQYDLDLRQLYTPIWYMRVSRQTHKHADRNTSHPFRGRLRSNEVADFSLSRGPTCVSCDKLTRFFGTNIVYWLSQQREHEASFVWVITNTVSSNVKTLMIWLYDIRVQFFFKNCNLENTGIDPVTSRMLSERSTIWANSPSV